MVTIGSGGIPKPMGGGIGGMDLMKRLSQMMGNGGGAPTPRLGGGAMGNPDGQLSMASTAPAPTPVTPMEPPRDMGTELSALESNPEGSGMGMIAPMQAGKRFSNPTIMNRIGDFVQSDRGRATLLRSGAATLQGGLGAGIKAGAEYYDDQKELENKQMNWVSEMGLKTRQTDIDQQNANQTGEYQRGRVDVDSTQAAINARVAQENARKNRVNEGIDLVEEEGRNTRFGIGDSTQRRGQDITVRGQDVSMRNTDVGAETSRYGIDSSRYTADENRAYQYGDSGSASSKLPNGVNITVNRKAPDYGEIKYDRKGNKYRLDAFTGKPVLVTE